MAPSTRTGRYDPEASTSFVVRTNLRRLRKMRGLTQDQAVARLDPPRLSASSLGKIETGDRSISIEETVQLSVAYQVPIQVIVSPWEPLHHNQLPLLSGGDTEASVEDIQNWLLNETYPKYPRKFGRISSSLEGAANTIIFRNASNLSALAESPTPVTYKDLATHAVAEILLPLEAAIDALVTDITEWCGFDPFTYFDDFNETPELYWPFQLDERLDAAELPDGHKRLEKIRALHDHAVEMVNDVEMGLMNDLQYATPSFPREASKHLRIQLARLQHWPYVYSALSANVASHQRANAN